MLHIAGWNHRLQDSFKGRRYPGLPVLDYWVSDGRPVLAWAGAGRVCVGRAQMYRVYIVGRDDRFVAVREIEASDDAAALNIATQYVDGRDVEVWQRERRVGYIPADHLKDQNPVVRLALQRLRQRPKREN